MVCEPPKKLFQFRTPPQIENEKTGLRATKKTVRLARDPLGPTPSLPSRIRQTGQSNKPSRPTKTIAPAPHCMYSVTNRDSFDRPGVGSLPPKPMTRTGKMIQIQKEQMRAMNVERKKKKLENEKLETKARRLAMLGIGVTGVLGLAIGCLVSAWWP